MKNAKAMILASFAGDALALGPHWIYDTAVIDEQFGRVSGYTNPGEGTYHPNRVAGEFTHYGDQTFLLLKNISEQRGFSAVSFFSDWLEFAKNYDGYMDGATRKTLKSADDNPGAVFCGSPSSDLGGAARMAPVIYLLKDNRGGMFEAVHEQTRTTHDNEELLVGADLIGKITFGALDGISPKESIEKAVADGIASIDLATSIEHCFDVLDQDTRGVIKEIGAMCSVGTALPGALYLILKHQDNLQEALIENVMAGGDSAARGLVIGMVLGAWLGEEAIPKEWLTSMKRGEEIQTLLTYLD